MLPKDPVMLLSVVNTRLRDVYDNVEQLCAEDGITLEELSEKLKSIGYYYERENNCFRSMN